MDRAPRVLVADDDEPFRDALVEGLALAGFEVSVAGSVSGVCELVEAEAFDVVLSDVAMPGDGATLPGRLQQIRPGLPVVLMTGLDQPDIHRRVGAAMVLLRKPISLRELRLVLTRAVAQTQAGARAV